MYSFEKNELSEVAGISDLTFSLNSGYYEAAKSYFQNGSKIVSYASWNTVVEKDGLLGLLRCIPKPDTTESMHDLAMMIGYALLQHIKSSFTQSSKLTDSQRFARDSLNDQLKFLENNEIEPAVIAASIESAMEVWYVTTPVLATKWRDLEAFMETHPFSQQDLTVQTLLTEYVSAAKSISPDENKGVSREALCVLSSGAKEALNYIPTGSVSKESMQREFGVAYAQKL